MSSAHVLPGPATAMSRGMLRFVTVALVSFLTLVDLFATQAILPSLARAYGVSPAEIGFAVNAGTIGMAIAGVVVALFSRHIPRRLGVALSLAILAVPTTLLATAGDLSTFTALRIMQGLCMSTAFTLTMAYLAESSSAGETAAALAAYITGNVASNLVGRLVSASIADHLGIASSFYFFAALNLAGAALAWATLTRCTAMGMATSRGGSTLDTWITHLRNPPLRASFAIGFIILFAFIGTFTYVNFVLSAPPIGLSPMTLGLVYLVFLPSMLTTPLAGKIIGRFGPRATFQGSLGLALVGLGLLVLPRLEPLLLGLALVAVGTFLAQAAATGFVGRAATVDRGSASGIYLASYYLGGLVGSAVLGRIFDGWGWGATVIAIGLALALAMLLARQLRLPSPPGEPA